MSPGDGGNVPCDGLISSTIASMDSCTSTTSDCSDPSGRAEQERI